MLFSELLSRNAVVLLDGAMGTELHRLGIDIGLPLWSANALLRAPHEIRNVHYHYLHAGADILTTNTFRSNVRAMRKTGYADRWEELNLRAVELAFEARDRYRSSRPVLIAGGLAPVEDCYSPELVPSRSELLDEHSKQAELLSMFGVDFLLAETMMSVVEAEAAAEACAAAGKEFAVSFVCSNEGRLLSGETLEEAVSVIAAFNPTALLVNCISALHIGDVHDQLSAAADCATGCYANTSTPAKGDITVTQHDVTVDQYAEFSRSWVEAGARIIGGCCGTTAEHISALARLHAVASLQQQEDEIAEWIEARNTRRSRPPTIDFSDLSYKKPWNPMTQLRSIVSFRSQQSATILLLCIAVMGLFVRTVSAQEDLSQAPREWIMTLQGGATKLLDDFSDTRFSNGGALSVRHHLMDFRGNNGSLYAMAGIGFYDAQWRTDGRMLQYFDTSVTQINDINRSFIMPFFLEALWRTRIGSEAELFLGGGLELTYFSPMNNSGSALPKPQDQYGKWTVGIPLTVMFDYMLTDHFAITLHSTLHPTFTDYLDGMSLGEWTDMYLTAGIGLTYAFPEPDKDSDYDGLLNRDERNKYHTNPYNADTDGDGLRDNDEIAVGTSALFPDTDGDGLRDGEEVHRWGTKPLKKDSDDDGLDDLAETVIGSNPLRADTDSDGLNDSVEQAHGTDPLRVDTDGDGLPDGLETQSSPLLADTDGDGLEDGKESSWSLRSYDEDFDADGLYDGAEIHFGTDPKKPDTDNDGATDYSEVFGLMSDPCNPDSDGDGIPDGTDPTPLDGSTFNSVKKLSWVFMEIFARGNTIDENSKGFVQMLHLIRSAPRQQVFEIDIQVFGRDMTEARARRGELERFLRKLTGSWNIPVISVFEDVEDTYYDARLRYIPVSGTGR